MPRWIILLTVSIFLLLSGALVFAQNGNATVIDMAENLNVRSGPSGRAGIVGEVTGRSAINVIARISTNRWYQITTLDGSLTGWVASGFVELTVALADIPLVEAPPIEVAASTTNTATSENVPVIDINATGTVNVIAANVRASASTRAAIIAQLSRGTSVAAIGRNSSSTWIRIQLADGQVGWIFVTLIDLNVGRSSLPVVEASDTTSSETTSNVAVSVPAGDAPYFTLGASAVNIFATGQALGNRANVFSKIGDSITVSEEMFTPFGFGVYNLGSYDYLSPTISFFRAQARDNNSFNNTSLAAGNGYNTSTILSSEFANPSVCNSGESPLACEYRLTRPAVALIMLGTNDTTLVPIDEFAHNMRVIADYSIANGVIPVLSTIPPRQGLPGRAESYNRVIVDVAAERGLPLWDYYAALVALPDSGMNTDGIHPSSPPLGFEQGADFRGNNLQYGYVMRNLTALQALHILRVNVLQ